MKGVSDIRDGRIRSFMARRTYGLYICTKIIIKNQETMMNKNNSF